FHVVSTLLDGVERGVAVRHRVLGGGNTGGFISHFDRRPYDYRSGRIHYFYAQRPGDALRLQLHEGHWKQATDQQKTNHYPLLIPTSYLMDLYELVHRIFLLFGDMLLQ